jgi:2,4-dienoyl-CoA reductase-like NADH-dependent reductase (Old Yellow Enzyme family)
MSSVYFRYKSRDEFIEDTERAGAPIELSSDYRPLFRPVRIGQLLARNSCLIHPMEGCDASLDGRPSELTLRRYLRFAKGGAAVIWGEATAVREEGRANTRQLWINKANWQDFARLVDAVRGTDAVEFGNSGGGAGQLVLGLQLTHSGRYCYGKPFILQRDAGLDQTTYEDPITKHRRLSSEYPLVTDDYVAELTDDYVGAARLAHRAGFDFVDIKQCHRYFLNEMLAARGRAGPYGGGYENRTRFIKTLVTRIRSEVPGIQIATRMNAFDGVPFMKDPGTGRGAPRPHELPYRYGWGTSDARPGTPDLNEPLRLARELQGLGISLLSVSMGNPYANPHYLRPADTPPPDGYEAPEHPAAGSRRHFDVAAEFQRALPGLPVVGAGYSWLRWLMCDAASANIASGGCALAGFGRAAIAYPEFLRDIVAGRGLDKNKVCITVSYCTALMRFKHNKDRQFETGCAVRDKYYAQVYKGAVREIRRVKSDA